MPAQSPYQRASSRDLNPKSPSVCNDRIPFRSSGSSPTRRFHITNAAAPPRPYTIHVAGTESISEPPRRCSRAAVPGGT
ncbi:hypothetical protein BDA96_10G041100 [Sorghum bicolor]|uniref:Uncharacterized protein n=1 Tax=Sorghum bicolor TaxID=4558 RepID=A0A921Q1L9_SORBI|nr:hypothetical protein BDA96_10G041100 [Sorghum bicolor]